MDRFIKIIISGARKLIVSTKNFKKIMLFLRFCGYVHIFRATVGRELIANTLINVK